MSVDTLGIWLVKPGHEDDFVQAWRDMAARTRKDFPDGKAVLMHDRDVPNRFISTEHWDSVDQIERWRASTAYTEGVQSNRDIVQRFEPHTLDETAAVG